MGKKIVSIGDRQSPKVILNMLLEDVDEIEDIVITWREKNGNMDTVWNEMSFERAATLDGWFHLSFLPRFARRVFGVLE